MVRNIHQGLSCKVVLLIYQCEDTMHGNLIQDVERQSQQLQLMKVSCQVESTVWNTAVSCVQVKWSGELSQPSPGLIPNSYMTLRCITMVALGHYAWESFVREQWLNRALIFHLLTLKSLMYYHFLCFSPLMPQPGLAISRIEYIILEAHLLYLDFICVYSCLWQS